MSKDLHEIIHYFETHNNSVSTTDLINDLKFSKGKIQGLMSGHLVRLGYGRYGLSPEFSKKFKITLPEGILRLDKQTFEFPSNISRSQAEDLVRNKIFERANRDNLLIKKINFTDNQYNLDFLPARYSKLNNHVVFDFISKPSEDLIKQARVWEGRGRWELGQYFRKIAEIPPQDYHHYHQSVEKVLLSIRKRYGDIGRIEKLSVDNNSILPRSTSSNNVSHLWVDSKSETYIFGKVFHQCSEENYKTLFSQVFTKFGLNTKRFVSMTFKKVLPAVGLVLSGSRIASADNKVETTLEEATIFTGGVQGGLIAALLATPTGPIGMATAGLAGSMVGSDLASGYHALRRKFKPDIKSTTSSRQAEPSEIKHNLSNLRIQSNDTDPERLKIYEDSYRHLQQIDEKRLTHYRSSSFASGTTDSEPETQSTRPKVKKISTRTSISSREEIKLTPVDKATAEFLVAYGASPEQVAQLYQDPQSWALAKESLTQFQEYERKLERQQDQINYISFFHGANSVFSALAQTKSRELARIGSVGAPIMMGLAHIETLWGVFSGSAGSLSTVGVFGSFGAIGGLVAAGIGLLNVFLGSDNGEQQRQLMESLRAMHEHISTFRREVHERFDRVETALQGIANAMMGYCNQILRNQQMLFEQNQKHIELSLKGFSVITSMISDLRVENRQFYERVLRELSYLTDLAEIEPIQELKESIERKVDIIKRKAEMKGGASPHRLESMISELVGLESDLKHCVSGDYNGKKQFALLGNNALQSLRFLARGSLTRDDALGFLAEEFERLTSTSLADAKIDKALLPVTALWSNAVLQYITLSRLPVFADFDSRAILAEIQRQSETVIRFSHHIRDSKVIPILLKKHHQHLDQFQLTLYHYFSEQQKKLKFMKEEEKVPEKRLRVGDYFADGADQKALHEIDYNYILLTRFSELAGLTPELQQQIARLDKSSVLLAQPFNFNEMPKSVLAGILADASYTAIGNWTYNYSYEHEHFETIAAALYGNPGEEKMVFISSMMYSEEQQGAAASCSLSLTGYDLATCRYAQMAQIHPHIEKSPFPLIQYKGNFNQSANHAWASTHVVMMSGRPHFVFHTGGSDYVAICDMQEQKKENQWLDCKNDERPSQFTVPLSSSSRHEVKPDTTCYTQVIRNRHLIITQIKWLNSSYPKIIFHGYDLINKRRLKDYEVISQFTHWFWNDDNLRGTSIEKSTSPNQFYINKIRPVGKVEAMVYGLLQPGEQLSASFYYNGIEDKEPTTKNFLGMGNPSFGTRSFPIAVKTIHQTHSQVLQVDGENILVISASITTPDDKAQLVVLSVDYFKNKFEIDLFDLPSLHTNSDWQAMRTAAAKIGDREHLIVTLLNPEYQMMIFSYDPHAKELRRLADGPQLKFINFHENGQRISYGGWARLEGDDYLLNARRKHPGFYPVRPIEIRVKELKGVSTLLIAYPTIQGPGPLNYEIRVMHMPLAPVLKIKSTAEMTLQLPHSTTPLSLEIPANHLAAELSRTQLLLSLPPVPAISLPPAENEVKVLAPTDSPDESSFELAFEICRDAQMLLSTTIPDLEIKGNKSSILESKMARMISIMEESEREIKPAQKLNHLKTIFNIINTVDGLLTQENLYLSGIGKNIDLMLGQLKDEIAKHGQRNKAPSPLVEQGVFSERRPGMQIRRGKLEEKQAEEKKQVQPPPFTLVGKARKEDDNEPVSEEDIDLSDALKDPDFITTLLEGTPTPSYLVEQGVFSERTGTQMTQSISSSQIADNLSSETDPEPGTCILM